MPYPSTIQHASSSDCIRPSPPTLFVNVPRSTSNQQNDMCRWVKEENRLVRVYDARSKISIVFHACRRSEDKYESQNKRFADLDIVWLNASDTPKILHHRKWVDLLKTKGCPECTCTNGSQAAKGLINNRTYEVQFKLKLIEGI